MQIVVADTGPINYLILIGSIDLLPRLFERVVLPSAVQAELSREIAPRSVRAWISSPPSWLEIVQTPTPPRSPRVHAGEAAAISLALAIDADLLLMDDRRAVREAKHRGLHVTGTLGVLDFAAERGLVDFAEAIRELETTNFRRPVELLESLLTKHRK